MRYEPALPESPRIRYELDFEFNFWSLHTQNLLLLLNFLQPRIDLSDLKWDHAVTSWIGCNLSIGTWGVGRGCVLFLPQNSH